MDDNKTIIHRPAPPTYKIDDRTNTIRVAAYCRVSTDKSDQVNSLNAQKEFFKNVFERNKNWLVDADKDIYYDEGISGTTNYKRDGFNKMIERALAGEYQLIVTKEVSRFYRNNKEIIQVIDDLKKQNVFVYFMTQNINTENERDYNTFLTMSQMAEIESRNTSARVKWGQQRCMENGVVFGRKRMLGYNIVRESDGKQRFEIIPDEAETVKRIFIMYAVEGKGTFQIARALENEGRLNSSGKPNWSCVSISRILRNEKYVGDLILGKTYTPDVMTHKKKVNKNTESVWIEHKEHHMYAAIIDRELWNRTQELLEENALSDDVKRKHSNRYWLSGKVECGLCHSRYISHIKKQVAKDPETGEQIRSKRWGCFANQQYGNGSKNSKGCPNKCVNDKVLEEGMRDLIGILFDKEDEIISNLEKEIIDNAKKTKKAKPESVDKKIDKLITERDKAKGKIDKTLSLVNSEKLDESLGDELIAGYNEEIKEINNELEILERQRLDSNSERREEEQRIQSVKDFFGLRSNELNEILFRKFIDKIVVYPDNILEFYFTFLRTPEIVRYETKGRMKKYKATFKSIDENPHRKTEE